MTPEERQFAMFYWNAAVVCGSLYYLGETFLKSAVIAIFFLISCCIGYCRSLFLRAGAAASVIAIAVLIGILPPPEHWLDIVRDAWNTFASGTVPNS